MTGTSWSRLRPRLAVTSVVTLMTLAAAGGCKNAAEAVGAPALAKGCMLGYDNHGIACIRLSDGSKHHLLRNYPGHVWTIPVWSPKHGRLFCVLNRTQIAAKRLNQEHAEVIYTAPPDFQVEGLAVVGGDILAVVSAFNLSSSQLVAVSILAGTSQVVPVDNLSPVPPERVSDTEAMILRSVRTDDIRRNLVAKVDTASGGITDLFALPQGAWRFRVSPSGSTIVTPSDDGVFYRGSVATGDFEPLDIPKVPSWASRGIFCFAGEGHILIWKQKDAMCPLGMHIVNLSTGKTRRFSWAGLDSITCVPDCSEFSDGIGGRPR